MSATAAIGPEPGGDEPELLIATTALVYATDAHKEPMSAWEAFAGTVTERATGAGQAAVDDPATGVAVTEYDVIPVD